MKTIVCFGDSNTHGYRAEDMGRYPLHERFPGILQQLLGDEYDVKEEGLSGRTLVFDDPLFEGLNGLKAIYPVLRTHEPVDLLIVMLGTNDTKARFACSPENIARALERFLLRTLTATDCFTDLVPRILFIAPPPIEKGILDSHCAAEMGADCYLKSERLAPLFQEVCERLKVPFLDAGQIEGIHMNTTDYMHLTAESHNLLAHAIEKKMVEL